MFFSKREIENRNVARQVIKKNTPTPSTFFFPAADVINKNSF